MDQATGEAASRERTAQGNDLRNEGTTGFERKAGTFHAAWSLLRVTPVTTPHVNGIKAPQETATMGWMREERLDKPTGAIREND